MINPSVRFYISKIKGQTEAYIFLDFSYRKGRRVRCSVGQKILPSHWSSKTQRPKELVGYPEYIEISEFLDNLEAEVKAIYRAYQKERKTALLTPTLLKNKIRSFVEGDEFIGYQKEVLKFIESLILERKASVKPSTTKQDYSVLNHLKRFVDQKRGGVLTFEECDYNFFIQLRDYSFETGMGDNTAAKKIKTIKGFLKQAGNRKLVDLNQFIHISLSDLGLKETPGDEIALTAKEVKALYKLDLVESPHLDRLRDLFIIACYTGLRYSDYHQVKKENINEDGRLFIATIKTGAIVTIPLHPIVLEILEKYNYNLPPVVANQPFNRALNEICKKAGFTELTKKQIRKARKVITTEVPKYERIRTHTARRSFATNLKASGVKEETIARLTGHSNTDTLNESYIKNNSTAYLLEVEQSDFFKQ